MVKGRGDLLDIPSGWRGKGREREGEGGAFCAHARSTKSVSLVSNAGPLHSGAERWSDCAGIALRRSGEVSGEDLQQSWRMRGGGKQISNPDRACDGADAWHADASVPIYELGLSVTASLKLLQLQTRLSALRAYRRGEYTTEAST